MPSVVDTMIIAHTRYDRRIKLTPEDKEEIVSLYTKGGSIKDIAKKFRVSRRTIQFIVNPRTKEENMKRRKERGGWRQYYDTETNTKNKKESRRYKQELFLEGKI